MVLDLKSLFINDDSSKQINCSFDFSSVEINFCFPLKSEVSVHGDVENRAGVVTLSIKIELEYVGNCDRCYKETVKQFSLPVSRVLVNELAGENDEHMLLLDDFKLDLEEFVREEIILGLPSKILCKDDCKGLCEKCGKDLNLGPCDCPETQGDERFSVLDELLS